MKSVTIGLFILIPVLVFASVAYYRPECWRNEITATRFQPPAWPARPFIAVEVDMGGNEPLYGYPMHSGIVKGVSDTIRAILTFRNQDTADYYIGSQTPENWFVPAVFSIYANTDTETPLIDTANFDFAFKYWGGYSWAKTSKPTHLFVEGKDSTTYSLTYYIWGLPAGEYRVVFKKTNSAPQKLIVINGWAPLSNLVWIVEPSGIADTINGLVHRYFRAQDVQDLSAKPTIANLMLSLHPKSIVGYFFRYEAGGDSLMRLACLDSVLTFCRNYRDRALPDSASLNHYQRNWLNEMIKEAEYGKYLITNQDTVIYVR